MIYIIFLCVYYEKNHLSIPSLGLATAAALIATTSFSCWLQSLKWKKKRKEKKKKKNRSWKDNWTNTRLYKGLPKLSDKLKVGRMKLAGDLVRHPVDAAHDDEVVLWEVGTAPEILSEEPLR